VSDFLNSKQPHPGDYSYNGRHDDGQYEPPREGGPMTLLIGCVQAAKAMNDEYLSGIIEKEKEEVPHKKAKT